VRRKEKGEKKIFDFNIEKKKNGVGRRERGRGHKIGGKEAVYTKKKKEFWLFKKTVETPPQKLTWRARERGRREKTSLRDEESRMFRSSSASKKSAKGRLWIPSLTGGRRGGGGVSLREAA